MPQPMFQPASPGEPRQPGGYKHYLLGLLTIILLFNYVDRLVLGIVLEDLKVDLGLSDTQLGLLTGLAFAVFYSIMGIPLARWADRGNRVTIISLTTLLWSVGVALCGTAASFGQLLLIRVGVAVGEAGCIPPAYSLMADYYTRAERPRAAAIYGAGGALSSIVGYFLAGWLNEVYGWRWTFIMLGAPGLILAVLALLTLREPRKLQPRAGLAAERAGANLSPEPSLTYVGATLWRNTTFRYLTACLAVLFFFNYGVCMWLPTFLIRSFHLGTQQVGMWLAVVFGIGGLLGAYLGGELPSRFAPNNERLQLKWTAVAICVAAVAMTSVYLSHNVHLVIGFIGITAIVASIVNGPLFATIQTLVPDRMRAVAFALVYLIANLVGMGLGPLATGALSDVLRPWAGEESLRYALLCLSPGYFLVGWLALKASTTVSTDLAKMPVQTNELIDKDTSSMSVSATA